MKVNITPFMIDRYEEVYKLWMSCKNMGFNNVDDTEEGIRKLVDKNPKTCYVAEADGAVVGTVLAGNDGRRGYVYHLCVSEACRKQGIGKRLMDAMIDGMREEGISKVALVVFAYNDTANAFYEKIGFIKRDDIFYRNIALIDLERIDT
ncbi:MAG: GNAT family N-acetyltransferase [Lachnospiraceae bacterium]|nr:GNAT family N-acetyltransferase [Lachnospiraceae bacterium]